MSWKEHLLTTSWKRVVWELSWLCLVLWGCLLFLPLVGLPSDTWMPSAVLLCDVVCMLFYVLRLRMPARLVSRQTVRDGGAALLLCVGLSFIAALYGWLFIQQKPGEAPLPPTVFVIMFLSNSTGYVLSRLSIRVLVFWNKLRRKHLLWALTHSHVLLIVIVAGLFILFVDMLVLVAAQSSSSHAYNLLLLLPLTILLFFPSALLMMIIVPPFALFSYFVVRRTTDRLRLLMAATSALRGGNYAVRVPIAGEDEVAQLQTDFNMMAADLERTMHALQEERDRVAKLLQERRELIANVSHELCTPVATLRGYLETALIHWDEMSPQTLHHDVQIMEDEVLHLQERVEDLFTLARADIGVLKLQCELVDVRKLVQRVVETKAPLAWRSSRIEVVAALPEEVSEVLADPQRLEQALQNLLHNALRYTAPGGIVAVAVEQGDRDVMLHVKDTGEGIAAEDLPHIWERFYQSKRTSNNGGGSGLGLALVKEWVETMGGTVAVESVLGEGSCFTIRLPHAPADDSVNESASVSHRANAPID